MRCWFVAALVLGAITMVAAVKIQDPYWRDAGIEIFSPIKFYDTNYAFKLLETSAEDTPEGEPLKVYFTIKETVCFTPLEEPIEECDFKDGGTVLYCTVSVPEELSEELSGRIPVRCNRRRPEVLTLGPSSKLQNTPAIGNLFCCKMKLCSCKTRR